MIVQLTYFKPESGKLYDVGKYKTEEIYLFRIIDEVRIKFRNHKRPGLVDGEMEFDVVITVSEINAIHLLKH